MTRRRSDSTWRPVRFLGKVVRGWATTKKGWILGGSPYCRTDPTRFQPRSHLSSLVIVTRSVRLCLCWSWVFQPVMAPQIQDGSPAIQFPTDVPDRSSWLQKLGIAIEVICPTLALIVVVLRVHVRRTMMNFGWGRFSYPRLSVTDQLLTNTRGGCFRADDGWICAAMVRVWCTSLGFGLN